MTNAAVGRNQAAGIGLIRGHIRLHFRYGRWLTAPTDLSMDFRALVSRHPVIQTTGSWLFSR